MEVKQIRMITTETFLRRRHLRQLRDNIADLVIIL